MLALVEGPGSCHDHVDYQGPGAATLQLDVTVPDCARPPQGGDPFPAGDLSGTITRDGASSTGAVLVGATMVVFNAAELPDPGPVLALLGPIDPGDQIYYVP